jgi:hypothetical protein
MKRLKNNLTNILTTLTNIFINVFIIVSASLGGMVSIAFIMYLIVGAIYISLRDVGIIPQLTGPTGASQECSRGNGIAWLSILFGGLIGFVGGFVKSLEFLRPLKDEEQNLAVRLPLQ